jgi:hypothetical protein
MNWKVVGRKRSWPNFKVLYRHLSGGTKEINENSQYKKSPSRDLKPGPPKLSSPKMESASMVATAVKAMALHM